MSKATKSYACVICGAKNTGYGNNPAPLATEGKCCDNCNWSKVIPARLQLFSSSPAQA